MERGIAENDRTVLGTPVENYISQNNIFEEAEIQKNENPKIPKNPHSYQLCWAYYMCAQPELNDF